MEQKLKELSNSVDMLSKTITESNRNSLSSEQLKHAKKQLIKKNLLFPQSVKSINDPVILNQEFGLVSFTPAKDAKPNQNGLYGVLKLRGNFPTLDDAQKHAENLVRNHDSYNEIYTVKVGNCIPLSKEAHFVEDTDLIDLNKQVENIVSADIREKRIQEKQEIKTIKEREQNLLKENKEILNDEYKQDPLDNYIMVRVKKAQLMWTLIENRKRILNELIPALKKVKVEINNLNKSNPTFDQLYYERYTQARESVGLKTDKTENYENFLAYLLDDKDIDLNDLTKFFETT